MFDIPYRDPMRDLIEGLELDIELAPQSGSIPNESISRLEPALSKRLTELEHRLEGSEVVPAVPAPLALKPEPRPHLSELPGVRNPDPPALEETGTRGYAGPPAAPAATPLVTRDGITPPSYRPRLGGSAGTKYVGPSTDSRLCPKDNSERDIDNCRDCQYLDKDAETCRYEEQAAEAAESGG
jgi:hypothetical protein